jgi:hypothetical protein
MSRRTSERERQKQEAERLYNMAVIIAFIVIAGGLLMILFEGLPVP